MTREYKAPKVELLGKVEITSMPGGSKGIEATASYPSDRAIEATPA